MSQPVPERERELLDRGLANDPSAAPTATTGVAELTVIGLTPEQDIRDRALSYASDAFEPVGIPDCHAIGDVILDLAARFAAYIEHGDAWA